MSFSPLVVDEITVIGSRCGPFARAIELLGDGRVNVKPLVAGIYPLEQFAEAFDRAKHGLKVILTTGRLDAGSRSADAYNVALARSRIDNARP